MRSKIGILLLLVAVSAGIAWRLPRPKPSPEEIGQTQNSLPPETRKILDEGERFILFSLDPIHPVIRARTAQAPGETFHEYAVLGKTEIRDGKQRGELLRALYQGISDSDGFVAACFDPRHGISATLGGETVDLVICFECKYIQTHAKAGTSVSTERSPAQAFNRALEAAGIPIAK